LSVGEVAKVFQIAQSSASRNLRVLRDANWLRSRPAGPATFYRMVLDDLPANARSLWITVREQLGADDVVVDQLDKDDRRLEAVLADRRSDSLAYFGRVAGEWDDIRSQLFGFRFTADALLALLPSQWHVADVGCGTGNVAELLAPHVEHLTAIDLSEPMLDAARVRLRDAENVTFRVGEATRLPLDDGSIDALTCVLLMHHVEKPVDAMREFARVLKPGGLALLVDMAPHTRDDYREQMGHVHLGFVESDLEAWCEQAGFGGLRFQWLAHDPDGRGPGLFAAVVEAGSRVGRTRSESGSESAAAHRSLLK